LICLLFCPCADCKYLWSIIIFYKQPATIGRYVRRYRHIGSAHGGVWMIAVFRKDNGLALQAGPRCASSEPDKRRFGTLRFARPA
jgi:hypothetical protein